MNFDELLKRASNEAYTENGALSNASTLDHVLDLFAVGGAARTMSESDIERLIDSAYAQDKELALRVIFYLGDIRKGQGERNLFNTALARLVERDPEVIKVLVDLIPEFSRWDYLYTLIGTDAESVVKELIKKEFATTQASDTPSLMYKWLKSTNTSSDVSKKLGRWTAATLGYSRDYAGLKAYQHMLKRERAKLNDAVVETKLSRNRWEDVDYSKVPSKASLKYKNAFYKHDEARYESFIQSVLKGETKINAGVLYPHDIVANYRYSAGVDKSLEAMWKSLPNYIPETENVITVVDTSGSMSSPIDFKSRVSARDVAFALGAYTAQRLKGVFSGKVISFSSKAKYFNVMQRGNNLLDMLRVLDNNSIVDNTNLQSVFDLILDTAVSNNVPQSELPTKVVIISDMEFDYATEGSTNLDVIKRKYKKAGYEMPELVFWNVCARNTQFPATVDDKGVALVSGYSPVLLTQVLSGHIDSPVEVMLKTVVTERYNVIGDRLKWVL